MFSDRIEGKWVKNFIDVFRMCGVKPGEIVAILSETQSRAINVQLAELALAALDARFFHVTMPTPKQTEAVPVRSTGSTHALQRIGPAVSALSQCGLVVDCTLEGMLHAPELPEILKGGARLYMVSNEHPEVLERLMPDPALKPKIMRGMQMLAGAKDMRVTSKAGSDLTIRVEGAPARGAVGFVEEPGKVAYWPGGLCLCFPKPGTVNGRLVFSPGDANLTFKSYFTSKVTVTIEEDYVRQIEGEGLDAEMMRSYYAAWNDKEAYAVSHVGWGMNPACRWDAMVMYDRRDINGTELRAFAGNFLFSTGANEHAGRFTKCHFDLPMRNCSVSLDGKPVVVEGELVAELR